MVFPGRSGIRMAFAGLDINAGKKYHSKAITQGVCTYQNHR